MLSFETGPQKKCRPIKSTDLSAEHIKSTLKGSSWSGILLYEEVASTNELAMSLAAKDDHPGNFVVLADSQEKGKGRLGRQWHSPPGKNIYMSLVLRPEIAVKDATMLTLLAAVSCAHAIRSKNGLLVSIKWPNDLIFSSKKLGGILTEVRADMDKVKLAVIGIGINVNTGENDFPDAITPIAVSILSATGKNSSRNELVAEILRQFEHSYDLLIQNGKQSLLSEWRVLSSTIGENVKVTIGDETLVGFAEDIDDNGMLLLRLQSGLLRQISAGDVTHLR